MTITKKIGMLAWVVTACALFVPQAVQAAGDIRSIDAVKTDSDPLAVCGPDYLIRVGQKIRFSIRLLNTNGASQKQDNVQCPWMLKCQTPGWESTANLFPLQLGLWVGGHRAWATLEDITPLDQVLANNLDHAASDELIPLEDRVYYTRMLFSYEVEPGDIAMPVTFCNATGTGPLEDGSSLCFNNTFYWGVADRLTGSVCSFVMGTSPLDPYTLENDTPEKWTINEASTYEDLANFDLSMSGSSGQGFFVQTVDFDGTGDPWRTIPAGSSNPAEGAPAISIPGGAATNTTVYVWTTNSNVVVTDPDKSTTEDVIVGYSGATPLTMSVQMLAVSIANTDSVTFKLKAMSGATGKSTEVFLSSSKGFLWTSAGVQVKNYSSRRVLVSEPELPGIVLSVNQKSITCDADTEDAKAQITIEPTQVLDGETYTVHLDVRYDNVDGTKVESGVIGLSTDSDSPYTFTTDISFTAGQEKQIVYVFGLGFASADPRTIFITPSVTGSSSFTGKMTPTQFMVKEAKPEIVDCPGSISAVAKTAYELKIKLADSYANLKGKYTVEWMQTETSSSYKTIEGTYTPSDDNEIVVPLIYDMEGDNKVSRVRVIGPDGNTSDYVEFNATVAGAKSAVLLTNREDEENYHTYAEGEKVSNVRVMLKNWKNETSAPLYAFLIPTNTYEETSLSDYLSTAKLFPSTQNSRGVKIAKGDTTSTPTTEFTILDNITANDPIEFAIEIRTKQAYNDASGERVLFVSPEDVSANFINATNCAPRFKTLGITGGGQAISDGKTTGQTLTAEQGITKFFAWAANDVAADLPGIVTKWTITNPSGIVDTNPNYKWTYTGDPSGLSFSYAFNLKGAYTVKVQMYDKDMDASDESSWTTYSFTVNVGDAPAIGFAFPDGTTEKFTFGENAVDLDMDNYFRVGPLTAAVDPITICVKATSNGSGKMSLYGADSEGYVTLTIPAGVTLDTDVDGFYTRVDLADMDGTSTSTKKGQGIKLYAKCTTTTSIPDGSQTYADLYKSQEKEVYVENKAPSFVIATTEPAITGTNTSVKVSANQTITVSWEVTDVTADMTGLTLKWSGKPTNFKYADGVTDSSAEGSATFSFSGTGSHTITLYVTDKDKGVSEQHEWTFIIDPSRDAYLIPMGPDKNGQSSLSAIYAQADGLGAGYVYAEGSGEFTKAANFWHYYSFTEAEAQPTFFAKGYNVGDTDDGNLSAYDHAIDASGNNDNSAKISNYFKYNDSSLSEWGRKDSFFYAWVYNATDESSVMTGTAYPSPAYGKQEMAKKTFTLPSQSDSSSDDDDNAVTSYPKLTLEAVFAREFYAADNLGDINADGVPDYFAKKYDLYTLMAAASGSSSSSSSSDSSESAGGLTDGLDVKKNVAAYNSDEPGDGANTSSSDSSSDSTGDFLPYCYDHAGTYSWAAGTPFKAVTEIRGFHEGLNESSVSDVSISDAERVALNHAYALAVAKGVTHDCATADEWMLKGYWSPEMQRNTEFGLPVTIKRCDPTSMDTDADDIPDGYEYYIWYLAKIGTLDEDGNLVRMTGSRFNLETPGKGEVVPAEVLAAAFNPVEPRAAGTGTGRTISMTLLDGSTFAYNPTDFDEDGIADWVEVAMGTNPANWDTDGDGISDYWEALYGTDPCDPVDADRTANWTKSNPDRDFMALAQTPELYNIVALDDGHILAFAEDAAFADSIEAGDAPTHSTTLADGTVYYFKAEPQMDADKKRLLYDTVGYLEIDIKGTKYAVTATNFPAWTPLTVEAVASGSGEGGEGGEGEGSAAVTFAKWKSGAKALPVFLYGGAEYVPACTNVKDNAETEIKTAKGAIVTDFVAGKNLTLLHYQVYSEYGFDPRTAWTIDDYGYVGSRWHKLNSTSGENEGASGLATNTVPYTTRDEYLLADYLHNVFKEPLTQDSFEHLTVTTCPSQQYAVTNAINEADNKTIYGADTDGDGIPDAWELYVGMNPNDDTDAKSTTMDNDGLAPLAEYAGTDACYAYTNLFDTAGNVIYIEVSSIVKNNPGTGDGWYNKFFPTDPWDADTDGDGLNDDKEGASWKASVPIGRGTTGVLVLNFIYGDETECVDDGSCCIRGGGLNPCTVDTDQDLLPDAWEYEFAGYIIDKTTSGVGTYIEGGMDGTWSKDAFTHLSDDTDENANSNLPDPRKGVARDYDFDYDGLQNFQEYLVQAMRHFRYDDSETPLMGRLPNDAFVGFIPMQTFDGTAFFEACRKAGFNGSSAWKFRELGYFARPPKAWDRLALNVKIDDSHIAENIANYADYEGAGWRIMLRPQGLSAEATAEEEKRAKASGYCCTDPRKWDTDNDGMDDYYELFHGLNPLYGGVTDPLSVQDSSLNITDVIGSKYGGQMNACINAWTGWPVMMPTIPDYDVMKYPWMIGDAACDTDGDGLRNYEEALLVNITSPTPTHTDPTPLWMTDTTIANKASFTAQYYGMDPYQSLPDISSYPWAWSFASNFGGSNGQMSENGLYYMFAFEENEGYDTDHDGTPDGTELTKGVNPASDPLLYSDPDRRQALWFPGENAAAVSCSGTQQRNTSSSYDMLRQFTVECWIKPERVGGTDQVILERVCAYTASTLQNKDTVLRANFRLGINADGCVYAEYQGDTADSSFVRITDDLVTKANVWVHYAITYDGSTFALYKDGNTEPVARALNVGVIPANGITVVLQDGSGTGMDLSGVVEGRYTTLPCALVLGAAAKTANALDVVAAAKSSDSGLSIDTGDAWSDFGDFYAGYVDEVRVWDGARSADEIAADYDKRYTFDDVVAQRKAVYKSWSSGAVRNDTAGVDRLPAELIQHYNFATLPGAVDATDVMLQPLQFDEKVLGNVRVDGKAIDLRCGWWNALTTHSTVYRNYNLVPWIPNAVAHLPIMDGSVVDSQYWSENYAGGEVFASEFPNTANPYPYYNFMGDRLFHYNRYVLQTGTNSVTFGATSNTVVNVWETSMKQYLFQLRSEFVGTSDLLPLGGAFAKRAADYWDGGDCMDAWSSTGVDTDGDGLPDWWEMLYLRDIYDASDWDGLVEYADMTEKIPAWEAYQRDLAKGMLPTATSTTDVNVAYRAKADTDGNGIQDWWEKAVGQPGLAALSDEDYDGLSYYAEYLIGQCFAVTNYNFPKVEPNKMSTFSAKGQVVPDYFLTVGKLYLGEMFADHDFIEDWWEQLYPGTMSAFRYDADIDFDGDGWSNFAERRASTSPNRVAYLGVDEITVPDYPVPTVALTVAYDGNQSVATAPVVVKAWRADDTTGIPDAIWNIAISGTTTGGSSTKSSGSQSSSATTTTAPDKLIGMNPSVEKTIVLGPGSVVQGSVEVLFKDIAWLDQYVQVNVNNGSEVVLSEVVGSADEAEWVTCIIDKVRSGDTIYGDLIDNLTQEVVGEVNYQTGVLTVDLSKMTGNRRYDSSLYSDGTYYDCYEYHTANLDNSYVGVSWTSKFASQTFPRTFYLSDSATPSETYNSRGHLREGKNVFEAFADLDGNGAYTPGEPYGVVTDIDVGWNQTHAFGIQMTDTSPSMMRVDLVSAISTSKDFESQKLINDRGINTAKYYPNIDISSDENDEESSYLSVERVRIVQHAVNGVSLRRSGSSYLNLIGVPFDDYIDLAHNPMFTERELRANGSWDLDAGEIGTAAQRMGIDISNVTSVTYRVTFGEGAVTPSVTTNGHTLATAFVNAFEKGALGTQSPATPVAPNGDITSIQPTFTWKHANTISKDYPAFRLRVYTTDDKLVYDSGIQAAPTRDNNGIYSWAAPIYVNMMTPNGVIFATTNNYYWTVSMLDAKFTTPNTTETHKAFRVNTSGFGLGVSDEGSMGVAVKYFGPVAFTNTTLKNMVRVQAFTTPDFTGVPAGEGLVEALQSVSANSSLTVNATLRGLLKGSYYVRAYIDSNGNGQRDAWESWGYACSVGKTTLNTYDPVAVTVDPSVAKMGTATVYIEDVDTDRDGLPDAWEMNEYGALDTRTSPTGNTYLTHVNPYLLETLSAYTALDVGGGISSVSAYPVILMMAAPSSTRTGTAGLLGAAVQDTVPVVSISSFSLDAGLTLDVSTTTTVKDGAVAIYDTSATSVTIRWTLQRKTSLVEANWTDTGVTGTITVPVNGEGSVTVSADKIRQAVSSQVGEASGFFNVAISLED